MLICTNQSLEVSESQAEKQSRKKNWLFRPLKVHNKSVNMAKPKMDLKMFAMPAMLLLSRKIAFTTPNPDYVCDDDGTCPDIKVIPKDLPNEDMIQKAQMGLATVVVVLMTLFY